MQQPYNIKDTNEGAQPVVSDSPPVGAMVLAVCSSFQCLAYRDEKGTWRHFFGKLELQEPVQTWKPV